jgi:DNA-binding winged helix-turn-helix (wHTH) protein
LPASGKKASDIDPHDRFVEGMPLAGATYKFGEFELDCDRFQLRRNGRVLKLERIPLDLLILLVERDGSVVPRQEIADRLWGKDVFVDTEHGTNTAIRKIRAALSEDADKPRYVLTVPGRGYRFGIESGNGGVAVPVRDTPQESKVLAERSQPSPVPIGETTHSHRNRWVALGVGAVLCLILGMALGRNVGGIRERLFGKGGTRQIQSIAVLPLLNLSGDPAQEYFTDGVTDELITALAKNRSLRVVSRTSVMQYKGVRRPVRKIASELGVDGILEGSLSRSKPSRAHYGAVGARAE